MKYKHLVVMVMAITLIFMGGVFVLGFLDKQQKESNVQNSQNNNPSPQTPSSNQTSQPSASSQNTQTYTAADVAQHNKPSDCWLIIHGNVYNATSFLDQHPGGTDVIIPYCGKDATQAFETQDRPSGTHSQAARQMLQDYLVGILQ